MISALGKTAVSGQDLNLGSGRLRVLIAANGRAHLCLEPCFSLETN